MNKALELAQCGVGLTRPNPPVGAVLVCDGQVIAEGYHQKAGEPHAEVNCLRHVAGEPASRLQGATLYVSLEPCSTHGRTPPCTALILKLGIGRVVIGCQDPNPAHAGNGIDVLRQAGVEVITDVCQEAAQALIAPFVKRMIEGLPYVTLKLGITLDGRIADSTGTSQWITGPQAREKVQALRRRADAVMVGAGTVRADNPSLLPRPDEGRSPLRVVIGKNIPDDSKLFTDEARERTRVYAVDGSSEAQPDSLRGVLSDLAQQHDVMHLLCEGGGELSGALIRAGLVDEFMIFMAPSLLGGTGIPMVGSDGWALADMPRVQFETVEKCGEDILIRALPTRE